MAIIICLSSLNEEARINEVVPDTVVTWEHSGPSKANTTGGS
jgi:hypothetical protein